MIRTRQPSRLILVLAGTVISLLFSTTLFELSTLLKSRNLNRFNARLDPPGVAKPQRQYTYSVEDFPERWSNPLTKVVMEVEESVHYDMDTSESVYEWKELSPGEAPVRIGPAFHAAVLPLTHQLHCVEVFKDELKSSESISHGWSHTQHCANYLRQWAMCRADLTLERGDFAQRNFDWDRIGATHECLNWQGIYDGIAADWDAWLLFWKKNHLNKYVNRPFNPEVFV